MACDSSNVYIYDSGYDGFLGYSEMDCGRVEGRGKEVETFELDTGHCPHLTMTQEVVDVVNQVVARSTK